LEVLARCAVWWNRNSSEHYLHFLRFRNLN
jgi:hypothetical protein